MTLEASISTGNEVSVPGVAVLFSPGARVLSREPESRIAVTIGRYDHDSKSGQRCGSRLFDFIQHVSILVALGIEHAQRSATRISSTPALSLSLEQETVENIHDNVIIRPNRETTNGENELSHSQSDQTFNKDFDDCSQAPQHGHAGVICESTQCPVQITAERWQFVQAPTIHAVEHDGQEAVNLDLVNI